MLLNVIAEGKVFGNPRKIASCLLAVQVSRTANHCVLTVFIMIERKRLLVLFGTVQVFIDRFGLFEDGQFVCGRRTFAQTFGGRIRVVLVQQISAAI